VAGPRFRRSRFGEGGVVLSQIPKEVHGLGRQAVIQKVPVEGDAGVEEFAEGAGIEAWRHGKLKKREVKSIDPEPEAFHFCGEGRKANPMPI
jgi:hypothetical protein